MVLHEDHHHHHHQSKCKSSSKKNKAKKIPQRGLGVAQLEKLRIEEQQSNSSSGSAVGAASSASYSNPSRSLVLPAVAASPQQQRQPCLPSLAARSAISPSSSTTIDFFKADPIGFSTSNAEELKYLSSVWTEESGCFSNFDVPEGAMLENCGVWRSQHHHHHHQYLSPIRLIGNKAASTPMSSVASSLQMEPPSNQNYSISSLRREEERIAGTNLPWPFHPETAMSFPYRVPHFSTPFLKPKESVSMDGKIPLKFSKEGASSSNSCQVDWRNSEVHSNKRIRENGTSADSSGFLTLGSSSAQTTPRTKQAVPILPEFPLLQFQGATAKQPVNSSVNTFFSFLSMASTTHETDAKEENGKAVDDVDTRLKL